LFPRLSQAWTFSEKALDASQEDLFSLARERRHHAIEISCEYFENTWLTEEGAMLNLREKIGILQRQRAKTILGMQSNMIQKNLQKV
jgi:hypothetical protein